MMPEAIHLFSLIGVRALADYDPVEFRRTTDLSKREIDERIEHTLARLTMEEQGIAQELRSRTRELREIEAGAQSQTELSYLLRQLASSCLQRAQQLAFAYSRSDEAKTNQTTYVARANLGGAATSVPREEEYVRLGVMRLLRELPQYQPKFEYPVRGTQLDCFLEPSDARLPVILIEAKTRLFSEQQWKRAVQLLKGAATGWGKKAITAVLTTTVSPDLSDRANRAPGRTAYLLVYDPESNQFTQGADSLIAAVHAEEALRS
jgi:hypothetical protein